jgi:hypothetical protein
MQSILEKSKYMVERMLQIEPNNTYSKYIESANMSVTAHPLIQPSLDISPIWTSIIKDEVGMLQLHLV